jgi:hypothetical protein
MSPQLRLRRTWCGYRHSLQGRPSAFRKGLSDRVCKLLIPSGRIARKSSSTNT